MEIMQIVGIATGVVTVLGAVVGVTVYFTRLKLQIQQARLEDQLKRIEEKYSELETRHQSLLCAGGVVFHQKQEIDTKLSTITDAVQASASSILVPAPSMMTDEEPRELVFLSLLGPAAKKLKGTRVPLNTVAGYVFLRKTGRITHSPRQESDFSEKTDIVSDFRTDEMLAVPLIYQGRCIGVAEFLNKKEKGLFDSADQQLAERLAEPLAAKVGEFMHDPDNVALLGITPKREAEEATVMFSDLSNSSRLVRRSDASAVIDFLNDYFEELCDIGLAHGATIDAFIGDGFMLTFNVPRSLTQHQAKAVAAALEMQRKFDEVKEKWTMFQLPGIVGIYNRIGITCGPAHRAEIGHSQYRNITLLGDCVNLASKLCELGHRDRNVIIVGEDLYRVVSSRVVTRKLQPEELAGARGMIMTAYEVLSER